MTAWRKGSGLWRALAWASWRRNPAVSALQRPPVSTPKTTKRQRPGWTSSGYVYRPVSRCAGTEIISSDLPGREATGRHTWAGDWCGRGAGQGVEGS